MEQALTSRLFFALWPDHGVRKAIASVAAQLPASSGRRVPAENLHATLVFLGNITETARHAMECAGEAVCGEPFHLVLDKHGWWRKPQVLWLGASTVPPDLARLVASLNGAAAQAGLETDPRPYSAHVTLVRKASRSANLDVQPIHWHVREFSLVESITDSRGAAYRVCRSWRLGD